VGVLYVNEMIIVRDINLPLYPPLSPMNMKLATLQSSEKNMGITRNECERESVCMYFYSTEVTLIARPTPGTIFCNIYIPLISTENIITLRSSTVSIMWFRDILKCKYIFAHANTHKNWLRQLHIILHCISNINFLCRSFIILSNPDAGLDKFILVSGDLVLVYLQRSRFGWLIWPCLPLLVDVESKTSWQKKKKQQQLAGEAD